MILNGDLLKISSECHFEFNKKWESKMRYLVISDIHGGALELEKALGYFDKYKCDYIVLLGDILNHGPRNTVPESYDPMKVGELLNTYKQKIISIRGNCDSEVDSMVLDFPCNAPYGYINQKISGKYQKIFLTHGHLYDIDSEMGISKLGLGNGDIVLSGHTHVSGIFKKENGIVNINPGSITIPKGNTKAGFAVISEKSVELYSLDGQFLDCYSF